MKLWQIIVAYDLQLMGFSCSFGVYSTLYSAPSR